jgi:hypothetical protein
VTECLIAMIMEDEEFSCGCYYETKRFCKYGFL